MFCRSNLLSFINWRLRRKSLQVLPHFDVCVIGGGPAGIQAARRSVDYGKNVCIVEKDRIGGANVWNGTLQSKTLWELSDFVANLNKERTRRLYNNDDVFKDIEINQSMIKEKLNRVAEVRTKQLEQALEVSKIEIIKGTGTFSSPNELNVYGQEGGEYYTVTADYFIIAVGSTPNQHPIFHTNGTSIITTDEIMQQKLPESIVIVGAGVIGCEFASILSNFGKTKVNIIDKRPRILAMDDEDVSLCVSTQLQKNGVTVHQGASLFDMVSYEEGGKVRVQYRVNYKNSKQQDSFDVEKALIAVGRRPNIKGLELQNINCHLLGDQIELDDHQRCVPHKHIFAIGDVTGNLGVISLAEATARSTMDYIYGGKITPKLDVHNMTKIYFTEPIVSAVGLNEQQCQNENISYVAAKYGYEFVSRAVAMGQKEGFIKILCTNDNQKLILGMRAVGIHSSTIVELVSLAIQKRQSAYELLKILTSYPSITQGYQECLRMIVGRSIMKPNVFPQLTLKTWNPPNFERGIAYCDQTASECV